MDAMVGIVMRTKERPLLLRRALRSVLEQSCQDWILSLVNDGGDPAMVDSLIREIAERAGNRIRVIHHAKSIGMEAASNVAIRAVKTRYLVIHDDDDSWSKEFLTVMIAELERMHAAHPCIRGVVCKSVSVLERIRNNEIRICRRQPFSDELPLGLISLARICRGNLFPPISFLYYYDVLKDTGYYREDLPVLGDREFNVRFLTRYDIAVIAPCLARYHVRLNTEGIYGNSITAAQAKHQLYEQKLRNEWLRKDLERGVTSVGILANLEAVLPSQCKLAGMRGRFSLFCRRLFGCGCKKMD